MVLLSSWGSFVVQGASIWHPCSMLCRLAPNKTCPRVYTIDVDTSPLGDKRPKWLIFHFGVIVWILMLNSSTIKLFWFRFNQLLWYTLIHSLLPDSYKEASANGGQNQQISSSSTRRAWKAAYKEACSYQDLHDLSEIPSIQKSFLTERLWSIVFETLSALSSEFLSTMIVMGMHYADRKSVV